MFLILAGVSATKDVKKGEVLLSISSADIISVQAAVESPLAQSLQNVTLSPTILLGLFVLHEKNNAESKWKSYLDSLPTEFLTPIYFSAVCSLHSPQGKYVKKNPQIKYIFFFFLSSFSSFFLIIVHIYLNFFSNVSY